MQSQHHIRFADATSMDTLSDNSVDLVVTSPPYPMIAMWDEVFAKQNPEIRKALSEDNGKSAFELMHCQLDRVWKELFRVMKPGGIACINIGDATRTQPCTGYSKVP